MVTRLGGALRKEYKTAFEDDEAFFNKILMILFCFDSSVTESCNEREVESVSEDLILCFVLVM